MEGFSLAEYGILGLGWLVAWERDRQLTNARREWVEHAKLDTQATTMFQVTLERLIKLIEGK